MFPGGLRVRLLATKQSGQLWGISARRVAVLCKEGCIPGAQTVEELQS